MDWVAWVTNIIARIPVEKVLFPPRDNTKALEGFVTTMGGTRSPKEAPVSEKPTSTITRLPIESEVPTTEETLAQLKRRLAKELYKLELDLAAGLRTAGKPCDCLNSKHTLLFESVYEELIPLDPHNSIYSEIRDWVTAALPKGTFEAISSGRYDAEYPLMASEVRDFRKRIMGTTTLTAMIESKEQITLDEATAVIPTEPDFNASTINLLATTEGNPLRKFCCRQCSECAPAELLEEGKFPERIAWLRHHYKEKHPGIWGKHQSGPSSSGNCPNCGGPLDKDGCCPKCGICPLPKPTK